MTKFFNSATSIVPNITLSRYTNKVVLLSRRKDFKIFDLLLSDEGGG